MKTALRQLPTCFLYPGLTALLLSGCSTSSSPAPAPVAVDIGHDHATEHEHAHSHEEAGPHGGHLVPLGNEEYHLEWLHDDATGKVTAYILDGAAKADVPIEKGTVLISVKVEQPMAYLLTAVGGAAKSSQFEIEDPGLVESLKMAGEGVEVTTEVVIGEKTYQGTITHPAHGDGHGHKH